MFLDKLIESIASRYNSFFDANIKKSEVKTSWIGRQVCHLKERASSILKKIRNVFDAFKARLFPSVEKPPVAEDSIKFVPSLAPDVPSSIAEVALPNILKTTSSEISPEITQQDIEKLVPLTCGAFKERKTPYIYAQEFYKRLNKSFEHLGRSQKLEVIKTLIKEADSLCSSFISTIQKSDIRMLPKTVVEVQKQLFGEEFILFLFEQVDLKKDLSYLKEVALLCFEKSTCKANPSSQLISFPVENVVSLLLYYTSQELIKSIDNGVCSSELVESFLEFFEENSEKGYAIPDHLELGPLWVEYEEGVGEESEEEVPIQEKGYSFLDTPAVEKAEIVEKKVNQQAAAHHRLIILKLQKRLALMEAPNRLEKFFLKEYSFEALNVFLMDVADLTASIRPADGAYEKLREAWASFAVKHIHLLENLDEEECRKLEKLYDSIAKQLTCSPFKEMSGFSVAHHCLEELTAQDLNLSTFKVSLEKINSLIGEIDSSHEAYASLSDALSALVLKHTESFAVFEILELTLIKPCYDVLAAKLGHDAMQIENDNSFDEDLVRVIAEEEQEEGLRANLRAEGYTDAEIAPFLRP